MLSFNYEEQGENRFLVYQKNSEDQIDSMVVGQLSDTSNRINGILPIVQLEINNQTIFKMNVTGKMSLDDYFKNPVKPEDLLFVYKQLVSIFIEAEEYMLDSGVFVLDEQYIFLNPDNRQLFLIASPVIHKTVGLKEFFQRLLFQQYDTTSDTSIIMDLTSFFSSMHVFSLENFYKKIMEIVSSTGDYSVKSHYSKNEKKDSAKLEIPDGKKDREYVREKQVQRGIYAENNSRRNVNVKESISQDLVHNQDISQEPKNLTEANDPKRKGFFGLLKSKKDKSEKSDKKNSVKDNSCEKSKISFAIPGRDNVNVCHVEDNSDMDLKNNEGIHAQKVNINNLYKNKKEDFGETEIYDDVTDMDMNMNQPLLDETESDNTEIEEDEIIICLKLEDACGYKVPDMIELRLVDGYVTIGRYDKTGKACADFNFDYSLTFISREHVKIVMNEGGFDIIDLKSTNGTLLNGKLLSPGNKYSLHAGDTIMFSKKTKLAYSVT